MKFLFFICFLISTIGYSQKQYKFDYIFEYQVKRYKDTIKIKNHHYNKTDKMFYKYYLTNSKNNNYYAVITDIDSLHYKLVFTDYNGVYSNVEYLKSDLDKAEFINIDCKNVIRTLNPYKYKVKYYDIEHLKDTIIHNKSFWHYKISSNKPRRTKKKKLGTNHYIIDKSSSFHLPILTHTTPHEKWKRDKQLPNGILMEKYFVNYYGKLSMEQKLISYKKIDKKITLQKECDYAKKN